MHFKLFVKCTKNFIKILRSCEKKMFFLLIFRAFLGDKNFVKYFQRPKNIKWNLYFFLPKSNWNWFSLILRVVFHIWITKKNPPCWHPCCPAIRHFRSAALDLSDSPAPSAKKICQTPKKRGCEKRKKGKERKERKEKKVFGRRFVRESEFNFCVCRTENNRVNLFGFCLVVTSVPFRRRRRVEVPSRKAITSKRTIPLVFFLLSLCLEEKKRKKKNYRPPQAGLGSVRWAAGTGIRKEATASQIGKGGFADVKEEGSSLAEGSNKKKTKLSRRR